LESASDDSIGGMNWDVVVRDQLAKKFDSQILKKKKKINSIFTSKRAMAKLLREARDLKEQLSAGSSATIHMEELFEGTNFELEVSRNEFESWTDSLIDIVIRPLKKVISNGIKTGMLSPKDEIVVELFGGGVRVPSVQTALTNYFGTLTSDPLTLKLTLGKHVDGDEAAVFGSAHYASVTIGVVGVTPVTVIDPYDFAHHAKLSNGDGEGLSTSEQQLVKDVLTEWDLKAIKRQQSEEAKNQLETFVFETRDKTSSLKLKEHTQTEMNKLLSDVSQFLDDNVATLLSAEIYNHKHQTLKTSLQQLLNTDNMSKNTNVKLDL